jgi:sortase A
MTKPTLTGEPALTAGLRVGIGIILSKVNDGTADVEMQTGLAVDAGDRTDLPDDGAPADTPVEPSVSPTVPTQQQARRKQRVTRWDRPPEPHDWRFFVGHLGRILIVTGLMMFLFVAYQLWGTGIETSRAQNKLDDQFQVLVAAESVADIERPPNIVTDDGVVVDPTSTGAAFQALPLPSQTIEDIGEDIVDDIGDATADDADVDSGAEPPNAATPYETIVPAAEQNLPPYVRGDVLGRIEIPNIGVDFLFVPGVSHEDLKAGVGHFPDTPLPGQLGNSALAGHRTTYKAPFGNLDKVNTGEDIVITLPGATYTYVVTGTTVVDPSDYWVISNSDPNLATLTLITCTPKRTSAQRLVVFAELDPTRSGPVGQATLPQLDDPQAGVLPDEPPVADTVATAPSTSAPSTTANASAPVTTIDRADRAPATTSTPAGVAVGEATPATTAVTAAPETTSVAGPTDDRSGPTEGDAFSGGWFDDTAAWPHIVGWGALLAMIAIGANRISRKTRHDSIGILAGIVPFTVCLYFFFENVNRLLPPGL